MVPTHRPPPDQLCQAKLPDPHPPRQTADCGDTSYELHTGGSNYLSVSIRNNNRIGIGMTGFISVNLLEEIFGPYDAVNGF